MTILIGMTIGVLVTVTYFLLVANLKKPEDLGWLHAAWDKQLVLSETRNDVLNNLVKNLNNINWLGSRVLDYYKIATLASVDLDEFRKWLNANGFADIAECNPLKVDSYRIHDAMKAYWRSRQKETE